LATFFLAAGYLFIRTKWALKNPAFAIIVLLPAYGLICSKMIACHLTKMNKDNFESHFFVITLFQLNSDYFEGAMSED
jgi:hypothetical protein